MELASGVCEIDSMTEEKCSNVTRKQIYSNSVDSCKNENHPEEVSVQNLVGAIKPTRASCGDSNGLEQDCSSTRLKTPIKCVEIMLIHELAITLLDNSCYT